MRVGVIRGDVPSPIFLADLEPTSQTNFPTEPAGQSRYVSRPDPTTLTNFLAGVYASDTQDGAPAVTLPIPAGQPGHGGVGAGIAGTALSFAVPLSLVGANVLKVTTSAADFGTDTFFTATIASASYASMSLLLAAANAALAGSGITATTDTATGTLFILQSNTPGVGSYVAVGSVADGSTANTPLNLVDDTTFTMPTAATIITDMNPVVIPPATGSINVSALNITTVLGAAPAAAALVNLIAPQFLETPTAVQSYQVGGLAKYLELTWNPDSRRLPAITSGPAIQVVEDDGTTPFSSSALAPLPRISGAVHNSPNTGDITISGQGLGNVEFFAGTTVLVRGAASTNGSGVPFVRLTQKQIISTITDGVALTGTFNVTNGSATVTASLSQAGLLSPGNSIVFASQPTVVYDVSTVVTTTITLTTPYTGISNPLTTAKTPITAGVVSATSIVIPAVLLTTVSGVALGVVGSTVEVQYESFANVNYGTAASISWTAGVSTITGLTNQFTSQIGNYITISNSPGNNGTFPIATVPGATSVTVLNPAGVTDASGAIVWSEPAPVAFVVT